MIVNRNGRFHYAVFLWVLFFGLGGCGPKQNAGVVGPQSIKVADVQRFEQQIDELVTKVVATQYGSKGEFAPVAVIPGAIKQGIAYTHLEEVIAEALKKKLQQSNELYVFTSQNWFEYREGRPLSFWRNSKQERAFLRQLKIFEIRLNLEPLFSKADIEIVVSDANGHLLQGQRASETIDFSSSSPAARLNSQKVNRTPFPEGIEERPFTSMDRFAYSLVGDLIDTYQAGVLSSGRQASDEDVQVVLSVTPTRLVPERTIDSLVKALQHAIVRAKGVTCVLNPHDTPLQENKVQHGTVLLVVDLDRPLRSDVIAVAMRGVWQVSPLETASGSVVDADLAGTYLAGFTAKAYLQLHDRTTKVIPDGALSPVSLAQEMMVCFHGVDDVLLDGDYRALRHVPYLTQLAWAECRDDYCGCYSMIYTKSVNTLAGWLRRHLANYTDETECTIHVQDSVSVDVVYSDMQE